jgi:predicted nucleic acid-binding protein
MLTYLFDASAAIEIYLPRNETCRSAVQSILDQKTDLGATLFIPNICIAEVFNTFARRHFAPKDSNDWLDERTYKECLETFRDDIHWGKTLYPYDLNRYHILATDKIVLAEHDLPRREARDHLSTFDILILAMACELAYIGQRKSTYLVTCDQRLSRVCERLRDFEVEEKLIPGPLGKPEDKYRWVPPACWYLPRGRLY